MKVYVLGTPCPLTLYEVSFCQQQLLLNVHSDTWNS